MSTPSDPGSGQQPDPWAAPPADASGQGAPPPMPPEPPPAYGQQPPPPAYGQPAPPAYGQPPYGGPQPGYGQPAPGYGYQPAPTYTYASWGKRVGAFLLDFGVPVVIAVICIKISIAIGVIVYIAAVVWNFYNIYQGGKTGSRWGQKLIGIRMVREATGQPIGGALAIGRAFVHIIDGIPCYVGYLWPLWDAKKQTFADKVIGSVVINA